MQIYKFHFYIYKQVYILMKIYIFSFALPRPNKMKGNMKKKTENFKTPQTKYQLKFNIKKTGHARLCLMII